MPAASSTWRRPLHISDWAFVWTFPSDERSFRRAKPYSEFCAQAVDWSDFKTQALEPFEQLIVPMETLGLAIIRNASLRDYAIALRRRPAVVLFSHCNRHSSKMEFHANMEPYERVAGAQPTEFNGVLELSVCRPTQVVVDAIKGRSPAIGVAWMTVDLVPSTWLTFYAILLSKFCRQKTSYMVAEAETRDTLRSKFAVSLPMPILEGAPTSLLD